MLPSISGGEQKCALEPVGLWRWIRSSILRVASVFGRQAVYITDPRDPRLGWYSSWEPLGKAIARVVRQVESVDGKLEVKLAKYGDEHSERR
jgi:hypothetical protein